MAGAAGSRCRVRRVGSTFGGARVAKRNKDEAQCHRRHGRQSSTIFYVIALAGDVRWGPFLHKHEEKS